MQPFGHKYLCALSSDSANTVTLMGDGRPVCVTFARRPPPDRADTPLADDSRWRVLGVSTRASITEPWRATHVWSEDVVGEAIERWRKGFWPCDCCGGFISRAMAREVTV